VNNFFKQEILTDRFILRPLDIKDVTKRYADWLGDETTSKYISARFSLIKLRHYVADRSNRDDVLFLGIFNITNGSHIGNIKYEPIQVESRQATMGILIGEKEYRGKGVASEVIIASAIALNERLKIEKIILGVSKDNFSAIRAYEKIGFKKKSSCNNSHQMQLDLKKLIIFKEKKDEL
jgi:RimJ/RimL family protein N-acetyltransferase